MCACVCITSQDDFAQTADNCLTVVCRFDICWVDIRGQYATVALNCLHGAVLSSAAAPGKLDHHILWRLSSTSYMCMYFMLGPGLS